MECVGIDLVAAFCAWERVWLKILWSYLLHGDQGPGRRDTGSPKKLPLLMVRVLQLFNCYSLYYPRIGGLAFEYPCWAGFAIISSFEWLLSITYSRKCSLTITLTSWS